MTVKKKRRYIPAVGPRLKKLLLAVFVLFALLAANAVYLSTVTLAEWLTGETYQNFFYQYMFLAHLVLGFLIVLPVIIYGAIHISNTRGRPNRRAANAGYALFISALLLLITGITLTRGIPFIEIKDPTTRQGAYWLHALIPLVIGWLFVMHRLAGRKINWRAGAAVGAVAVAITAVALVLQMRDPRQWNVAGPESGEQYFFPSLSRTASGNFIPAETLMKDQYCQQCHEDVHDSWQYSMHRFSSFNNPAYLFSVRGTREVAMQRDGDVQAARFCAGCHDPVPFFSGAFDDPDFDDVNHITSQAGITCTSCHAITHVNSPRGNADYTIEEPMHYPFVNSKNETLQGLNRLLIKAKPEFHKKTFLKPLHKTTEFCGTCHKVHLPEELNDYKWLRGQNHYDSFLLSGVSGHGASSFYYPKKAEENCNGCHMELQASDDFGARNFDDSGELTVHDHQFPSANTAIPHNLGMPDKVNAAHREMLEGSLRLDLFGLKKEGRIDGQLVAPLAKEGSTVEAGQAYLLETVVRTIGLGHLFTQGTADSNQVWVELTVRADGNVIGASGYRDPQTGIVDAWAHFINAYILDKDGRRIDRRNAEDIFTALYNHQIPPGAADVVHYRFEVPEDATRLDIDVAVHYRKFDTLFYRLYTEDPNKVNDLPVTTIARERIQLQVAENTVTPKAEHSIPAWQRWNDYGIGLLRKGGAGELRQAQTAFENVSALGVADGELNQARVFIREGRLDDAVAALRSASQHDKPAAPWTITYLTGLVNKQNGYLEQAAENFETVLETRFNDARERGFDFSKDYRVLNDLATTQFDLAKLERGEARRDARDAWLNQSMATFKRALAIDPENTGAHYGLAQIYSQLGNSDTEAYHREQHAKYKVDDNARDRAVATARRNDPAANHAADAVVIYDLHREIPDYVSQESLATSN